MGNGEELLEVSSSFIQLWDGHYQPREGQRINLEGANFNQKSKLTW